MGDEKARAAHGLCPDFGLRREMDLPEPERLHTASAVRPVNYIRGTVLAVRPHPRGEHIWLADVRVSDIVRRIVWGGVPVVREGCIVPVLLPGMRDISGKKVRRRRYRGEVSDGILCSAAEAGIGPEADRVFIFCDGH